MRTLPSMEPVPERRPVVARPSRKALALCVLVTVFAAAGILGAASGNPGAASRWAYRAIVRARGGAFVPSPGAVLQSGFADCGPAALATLILTLGGDPPPTDSIGRLAGTGAHGTTFGGLARAARRLGRPVELRRLTPADIERLSSPVVAWVDRGHFVTVVPDSARAILVLDPEVGPYRIGRGHLLRFWSGEALVPLPAPSRVPAKPDASEGGGA
jgi:Peptidase C39 family